MEAPGVEGSKSCASVRDGALTADDLATAANARGSSRTRPVASLATSLDAVLADAVRRVRQAIETQASNAQWRGRGVVLVPGFADDAARNAVGGMLDLLERTADVG